jgi:hypothetical protein
MTVLPAENVMVDVDITKSNPLAARENVMN